MKTIATLVLVSLLVNVVPAAAQSPTPDVSALLAQLAQAIQQAQAASTATPAPAPTTPAPAPVLPARPVTTADLQPIVDQLNALQAVEQDTNTQIKQHRAAWKPILSFATTYLLPAVASFIAAKKL